MGQPTAGTGKRTGSWSWSRPWAGEKDYVCLWKWDWRRAWDLYWGCELPLSKSKTFANCRRHLAAWWSATGGRGRGWTRATTTETLTATIMSPTYCPDNQVLSDEKAARINLIDCKTKLEYPANVIAIPEETFDTLNYLICKCSLTLCLNNLLYYKY